MKTLIILGSIITPIAMLIIERIWLKSRTLFNAASILSALIFGNITALAIHQVLKDNHVFMTSVHAILLNPLFLITGSYLGVYFLYRLLLMAIEEA